MVTKNAMKTQRIEEMVEEYWCHTDNAEETEHWLRQALTEARQAGIDEAVEAQRNVLMNIKSILDQGLVTTARHALVAEIEALDDTIKALQDKKDV